MSDLHTRDGHLVYSGASDSHLSDACGCTCSQCAGGAAPCSIDFTVGMASLATTCVQIIDCPVGTNRNAFYWQADPFSGVSGCLDVFDCGIFDQYSSLAVMLVGPDHCPFDAYQSTVFGCVTSITVQYFNGRWFGQIDVAAGLNGGLVLMGYSDPVDCFTSASIVNKLTAFGCQTPDSVLTDWLNFRSQSLDLGPAIGSVDSIVITPHAGRCAA